MNKYLLPLLVIIITGTITYFLYNTEEKKRPFRGGASVKNVAAQVVTLGSNKGELKLSGRVRSMSSVALTSEVTGKINSRGFKLSEGSTFKKGEVLATLDNTMALNTYKSSVSALQNALVNALPDLKSDMPSSFTQWDRFFKELSFDKKLPPLPKVLQEREKLLISRFNIFHLYFQAENQYFVLGKHTIRAPFSGTVQKTSVVPYGLARAGAPLADLVSTDIMEIEFPVSPQKAQYVREGSTVHIAADYLSTKIEGTVTKKGTLLDEKLQTVTLYVKVDNKKNERLLNGSLVFGTIEIDKIENSFVVNRSVIHNDNQVYLIKNSKLAESEVTVGYSSGERYYLTGGVQNGDTLVTGLLQGAILGMSIYPVIDGKIISAPSKKGKPSKGGYGEQKKGKGSEKKDNKDKKGNE